MVDKKIKKIQYLKFIPLGIMIGLAIIFVIYKDEFTVSNISEHSPSHILFAIIFLLALYALKSLSIVFPVAVLVAVGGYIFGIGGGIVVNIFGIAIALSIPYWIGRFTTIGTSQNWLEKYPKLNKFVKIGQGNAFIFSLFSRTLFFLPCDILSIYMGTIKINYFKYILGGVIGFLPSIICTTIIGENVEDVSSPAFIIACCINGLVSIVSVSVYFIISKRKKLCKS